MTRLNWERRKILIWGKTRPELSKSYREVVCTGGVFADTGRLVRLYPIPLRYLDDHRIFKKYQWIEASVARNPTDSRPESYKIRSDGITTGVLIPPGRGNWNARAEWIMRPDNIFPSVEELQNRQREDRTSLGLVRPAYVKRVTAERVPAREKQESRKRYQEALKQMDLPLDPETGREIKPLMAADFRFKVLFRCDDPRCQKDHEFSILDWEMDALYFRQLHQGERSPDVAAQDVVKKLEDITAPQNDLHFFLGNIFKHPQKFTVVGLWYPKKSSEALQGKLFN